MKPELISPYRFLRHLLANECNSVEEIKCCIDFLQKLVYGGREAQRLLICFAIDAKRGSFGSSADTAKKLKNWIVNINGRSLDCEACIDKFVEDLQLCTTSERTPADPHKDTQPCFTVMSMQSYINHYSSKGKYDLALKYRYWNDFDSYVNPVPLGSIGSIPKGRQSEVYISDYYDVTNKGTSIELVYRLGFNPDAVSMPAHFVMLRFPDSFAEICYQPTAWNASWGYPRRNGNPFFLSFGKKDGWGRTFSSCGRFTEGVKERIFFAFNNFSSGKPKYVGFIPEKINFIPDAEVDDTSDKILSEGIMRFIHD